MRIMAVNWSRFLQSPCAVRSLRTLLSFQKLNDFSLNCFDPDNSLQMNEMMLLKASQCWPSKKVNFQFCSDKTDASKISGSNSFERMANHRLYVDKTRFIKIFLTMGRQFLLTFPRRWGKTSMISMLKNYYEIQVNE